MAHVSEEQLNLYLDRALPLKEHAAIETHLAGCETCRTELAALQDVFTALAALEPDPLSVDLTPHVLQDIAGERQQAARQRRLAWLVPGLQGVAILLLLVFGRSIVMMRFAEISKNVPTEILSSAWTSVLARGNILWRATVSQGAAWWTEANLGLWRVPSVLDDLSSYWSQLPDFDLSPSQIVLAGLLAALGWTVGNAILIRPTTTRSTLDRQVNH